MRTQRLPIATLALNDSTEGRLPPENLYRFALSPEDEAEAVAKAARAKGFSSAVILYPDGAWGTRIAKAFIRHWGAVGGAIEAGQMYDAETSSFDEPLEKLFQTAQYATSSRGLGTGADLIFFVGTERALRVIRPQIRAVGADRLPIFTTSHVHSSGFQALRDSGLTGVYFVDIPWMVSPQRNEPPQSELRRSQRGSSVDYQRLFALGLDAYRLAPVIAGQPPVGEVLLSGQTGVLRVDDQRRIQRQLVPVRIERWGFSVLQ
jgi:outer membrane PBP1 activator LpoA protein